MPRRPNYDRDELIARARDLFWQHGWAGTSLKDLESVLKMQPGSFYAAFGSKEALFSLTLEKYTKDGVTRLHALAREFGPLKALYEFCLQIATNEAQPSKACMLSKTFLELQSRGHPLATQARENLDKMEGEFAALFAEAQSAGQIDKSRDPKNLARKYQSDLMGLRFTAARSTPDAIAVAHEIGNELMNRARIN